MIKMSNQKIIEKQDKILIRRGHGKFASELRLFINGKEDTAANTPKNWESFQKIAEDGISVMIEEQTAGGLYGRYIEVNFLDSEQAKRMASGI